MNIELSQVWKATWILGIAMLAGLLIAVFVSYNKPRDYKELSIGGVHEDIPEKMELKHWYTLISAFIAFAIQLYTGKQRDAATGGRVHRFNKRFSFPGSK